MEDQLIRGVYRPSPAPTVPLPFGARSVGYYAVRAGWADTTLVKNFTQLFWGLEGEGGFTLGGRERALGPGQVFHYLPGDEHRIRALSARWRYRWLTLDGALGAATLGAFELGRLPRAAGDCPEELFLRLEQEVLDVSHAGQRAASASAYAILAAACGRKAMPGRGEAVADACAALLKERFADPLLDVNAAAARLKIHRTTLSKLFKARTGLPPGDYLASLRLQRALSLLKETRLNVAEVAALSGFADPDYFCKAFKKALGSTPARFRKS